MWQGRIAFLVGICALIALVSAVLSPRVERASANHVKAVSAGGMHACSLSPAGEVQCWGRNHYGQLGDGSTTDSALPVSVAGLESGVIGIAAGAVHTCAVTAEGDVKCWGANGLGAIGNGEQGGIEPTPVDVAGPGSAVAAVSAGFHHTCALTTSNGVKCWGLNEYGELGAPSSDTCAGWACSVTPVDVQQVAGGPLAGVGAVAAGGFHTCALTQVGGATCWGRNSNGQLGDGTVGSRAAAADVAGLTTGVAAISAGEFHSCALTGSGGVRCWGLNVDGQLGNGSTNDALFPVNASGLSSGVAAIDGGGTHSCALMTTGDVKCWGFDAFGQVDGVGGFEPGNNHLVPVAAPARVRDATAVSAGGYHTCVLGGTGAVFCWGADTYGQTFDTDGDGCSDFAEHGFNPVTGGLRDHEYYWDFFDTPNPDHIRDQVVTGNDIGAVVARFGAVGDQTGDPLAPAPPAPAYHTAFDREGQNGPNPWNLAPPEGSIVGGDISSVVAQFGHACG